MTRTTGTRSPRYVYDFWMSRDSDCATGACSVMVKIWTAKPDRLQDGLGYAWSTEYLEDFYGEWTLDECLRHAKVYPDDDRQCIHVAGDSVRQRGEEVDRS